MQDVSGFQLVPSQWWQTNHPCIFALQPQPQGSTQTPTECPSLQAWLGGADAESATQPAGFRGTLQWGMLQSYFGLEIAFCCFERCRMICNYSQTWGPPSSPHLNALSAFTCQTHVALRWVFLSPSSPLRFLCPLWPSSAAPPTPNLELGVSSKAPH